jgi:hypothetical protein
MENNQKDKDWDNYRNIKPKQKVERERERVN